MARYTESVCRLCRREGEKLFLKGSRCYSPKCAVARRSYAPGQHGQQQMRRKKSEYATQLREKQKTKRFYGVLESQFRKTYEEADRLPGKTGDNLLTLLERRIDNVVYRLGFAQSRAEARQMVLHEHFELNGHKVNIPSLIVKQGDVIEVREGSRERVPFQEFDPNRPVPQWLSIDAEHLKGSVVALPVREDVDLEVQERLIVELYSK